LGSNCGNFHYFSKKGRVNGNLLEKDTDVVEYDADFQYFSKKTEGFGKI